MRIGDLARATGTAVETIRFYEREGLMPPARRAANNYRLYSAAHAERLAFIRHCRSLDMTLEEVRALIRLREEPPKDCRQVNALLDEHIGHVAQRIRELHALQKELKSLRERCGLPTPSMGAESSAPWIARLLAACLVHAHTFGARIDAVAGAQTGVAPAWRQRGRTSPQYPLP